MCVQSKMLQVHGPLVTTALSNTFSGATRSNGAQFLIHAGNDKM